MSSLRGEEGEESRVEIEQQRRILSAEQLTFPASSVVRCKSSLENTLK